MFRKDSGQIVSLSPDLEQHIIAPVVTLSPDLQRDIIPRGRLEGALVSHQIASNETEQVAWLCPRVYPRCKMPPSLQCSVIAHVRACGSAFKTVWSVLTHTATCLPLCKTV